jgi:hypothetical protein
MKPLSISIENRLSRLLEQVDQIKQRLRRQGFRRHGQSPVDGFVNPRISGAEALSRG